MICFLSLKKLNFLDGSYYYFTHAYYGQRKGFTVLYYLLSVLWGLIMCYPLQAYGLEVTGRISARVVDLYVIEDNISQEQCLDVDEGYDCDIFSEYYTPKSDLEPAFENNTVAEMENHIATFSYE